MKKIIVNKDINAWSVISKWLVISKKRQIDLACLLNVTASAVSQIKSGSIQLNATQISLILDYLKIDSQDMCALYTLIFNARLNDKVAAGKNSKGRLVVNMADSNNKKDFSASSNPHDSPCSVPMMNIKQAMKYEPALESIGSFARECSEQTVLFSNAQAGSFALLFDEEYALSEFAHSAILLVSGEEYPVHGDMVVAKLRTGEVISKYYLRKDDVIHLKAKDSDDNNFVWNYREDPGYVQWMYPVIELNLKLRSDA